MLLTQRQAVMGLLLLQTLGALLLWISMILAGQREWPIVLASCLIVAGLTVAYWKGLRWVRYVNVVLLTLSTGLGIQEPFLTGKVSLAILVVPVFVLILTDWQWMLGSAALLQAILIVRAGGTGPYVEPGNLAILATAIGGMVIARLITSTAQRQAEIAAAAAAESAQRAEQNAREVEEANELLNQQLNEQQHLLDLVISLETPAVGIAEGVLLAPVIGHLDSRRAEQITQSLLAQVSERRVSLLILDITGVTVVDTRVAASLIGVVSAVRLLGCRVVLTGISAPVAISMTNLGVDLKQVETARDPQEALYTYLSSQQANPNRPPPADSHVPGPTAANGSRNGRLMP